MRDGPRGIEDVRRFIEDQLLDGEEEVLMDTPLLESGILDSASLMSLLAFVEERIGVRVPDGQLDFADVRSLRSIQALMERLQVSP